MAKPVTFTGKAAKTQSATSFNFGTNAAPTFTTNATLSPRAQSILAEAKRRKSSERRRVASGGGS